LFATAVLRRIAVLACLMGSVGAGPSDMICDPTECPGTCARPVGYSLDPRFDEQERVLVGEAMRTWEQGTGGRVRFVAGGRDLVIEKLDRADQLQPWDPDWPHHVALTKGGRIWIVAGAVEDPGEYRALVVHELGHHLGIGHIEDTAATYMHSMISDTPPALWARAELPERDGRAYCEVHRCTCAP
jgi:hypothetical protein